MDIVVVFIFSIAVSKAYGNFLYGYINPEQLEYLKRFGYLSKENQFAFNNDIRIAVKLFQKNVGLKVTGFIDNDTKNLMNRPRCGNRDKAGHYNAFSMRQKWQKNRLSYYFENFTPDINKSDVESIIRKAFQLWSDVSFLTFQQTHDMHADIFIKFASGDHGDTFTFDGPGGTLAHAFKPPVGDIHFDDDEYFTYQTTNGVNLLWVAVHEIGHALGLDHSSIQGSIMYPMYLGYQGNIALHQDDIKSIRNLYGVTAPTLEPVTTRRVACADNLPPSMCKAWKSNGYCQTNIRVQLECKNTCGKC